MQVNSNITLNSYEGMNQVPTPLPTTMPPATVPAGQSSASTPPATMDKPLVQPEQYQAQLENKKALDMFGQSTVINIGMGGRCPKSPVVDPAKVNTPTVTTPATSTPAPANPLTNPATTSMASEKFLESFSKMLDGFLASVSKMLDTFMTKMTDMIQKSNTPAPTPAATTPAPATPTAPPAPVATSPAPSTTPSVVSTPSTNTATVAPAAPRDLKPWEVKANEYLKTDDKGMVAESDMQEAIVKFQLYQKSDIAEQVVSAALEKAKASTQNRQSALKTALKDTVLSGAITQGEADYVYSISFRASQFDSEMDKISTAKSTGGLSAVNAIQVGAVNLTMIREGSLKLDPLSVAN